MDEPLQNGAGEDDLRATLEAKYDELKIGDMPESRPQVEATPDDAAAEQRARDERGRFAKKDGETSTELDAAPDPTKTPEELTETSPPAVDEVIQVPLSWQRDSKELFQSLIAQGETGKGIAREIAKRESEREKAFHRKMEEVNQTGRDNTDISQAIAPYRQQLALKGKSVGEAVKVALAAHDYLQSNPEDAIKWIAYDNGIDLATLAQAAPPIDPGIQQILDRQEQLESQLAQFQQGSESAQQNSLINEVVRFKSETDAEGAPLRPHYDRLTREIALLIPAVREENPDASHRQLLEEAYSRAVYAHPETRAAMFEQEKVKAEATRKQEQLQRIKQAERAGKSIGGNSAPGVRPTAHAGVRETLEANYDRLFS